MRKKTVNGFTLIEVMIVISILGILLAIATPNFMAYRDNTNLKEAARNVSSEIQLCKQMAIAGGVRYAVSFISGSHNFWIFKETSPSSGAYSWYATKAIHDSNAVTVFGTPSFMPGGVSYVTLYPRGTGTNGNVKLIHNTRLSEATITSNLMGRVKVAYVLK